MEETITKAHCIEAFQKLKSYFYFDTTNLITRFSVIEFESTSFEEKLEKFVDAINTDNERYFKDLINQIDTFTLPKKFATNETLLAKGPNDVDVYFNNINAFKPIILEKNNLFIKCPIELHLVSVLFLQYIGPDVEAKISNQNYGNRLDIDHSGAPTQGYRLFKPYMHLYKSWRDNCINTAKENHKNGNNTVVVNLDIKAFYYNCNFDFKELSPYLTSLPKIHLSKYLEMIHLAYNKLISSQKNSLPIGLLSSGVLANFYLAKFDREITKKLSPIYYGRYVDDILIALNVNEIPQVQPDVANQFIEDLFIKRDIFKSVNGELEISLNPYQGTGLSIQKSKVLIHFFNSKGTSTLIDKMIAEFKKNSSEFRFLPDDVSSVSFEEQTHSIIYKDSSNAIRNLKEFSINKFSVSKTLAKLCLVSSLSTSSSKTIPENTFDEIVAFFKGATCVELFPFWEKAFTVLILNGKEQHYYDLEEQIRHAIQRIKLSPEFSNGLDGLAKNKTLEAIQSDLRTFLDLSLAQALSLNVRHVKSDSKNRLRELFNFDIRNRASLIAKLHYIRHHYTLFPVLNFIQPVCERDFNYTIKDPAKVLHELSMLSTTEIEKIEFSKNIVPRFIHFHEIQILYILFSILETVKNHGIMSLCPKKCVETSKTIFKLLNGNAVSVAGFPNIDVSYRQNSFEERFEDSSNFKLCEHFVQGEFVEDKLKIGLVNKSINEEEILDGLLGHPKLKTKKYLDFAKMLNDIVFENTDLAIFPEMSVPFGWIPLLVNESKRKKKSFVFGIEHLEFGGYVFNFSASVLSFISGIHKNVYLNLRLKNVPSHEEKRTIEGHYKVIRGKSKLLRMATPSQQTLDLFRYKNLHFTIFNCFELSDIVSRAIFRSNVDLLIAIENNKDTNYFSALVDSSSRDLHCYVVQVNNSKWGDSRLTAPSPTALKDIIRLKGGKNQYLVTSWLDYRKLRNFQFKSYELQKDDGQFKPTPCGFQRNKLRSP